MDLTENQLQQIIPKNKFVKYWHSVLIQLLPQYEINTQNRIAAFLAQCAHESGEFVFIKENLNYKWQSLRKTFPKYFPTDLLAQQYEKQPQKIANRVYASRMGNGPEESGDGWRFCGRGLIQITGRENYSWFAASLEITPEEASEYMETFEGAGSIGSGPTTSTPGANLGGSGGGDNSGFIAPAQTNATSGTTNTGSGGGGGHSFTPNGLHLSGNGGSGFMVIRIPSANNATFSGGLVTQYRGEEFAGKKVWWLTGGSGTMTLS